MTLPRNVIQTPLKAVERVPFVPVDFGPGPRHLKSKENKSSTVSIKLFLSQCHMHKQV